MHRNVGCILDWYMVRQLVTAKAWCVEVFSIFLINIHLWCLHIACHQFPNKGKIFNLWLLLRQEILEFFRDYIFAHFIHGVLEQIIFWSLYQQTLEKLCIISNKTICTNFQAPVIIAYPVCWFRDLYYQSEGIILHKQKTMETIIY